MWWEHPWPGGEKVILAQLTSKSLCDLGVPHPFWFSQWYQESCFALARAQMSKPNSSSLVWVPNCLFHEAGTSRGQDESSLSPWCPQWPEEGPAWKGHRGLPMEPGLVPGYLQGVSKSRLC